MMPITRRLIARYRVVGFDQRGTGGSGLLRCPALERDIRLRSVAAGEACARKLGEARKHYTTPDSVADLEAIRGELGVERLTLFGISYGTELALAYARAHPDRVDRLILDSVVDPDDRDPFGLAGFRAIGPSLAGLCPGRCRSVSEDPAADLAALAARLRTKPMRGTLLRPPRAPALPLRRRDRRGGPALRLRLQPAAARRGARGRAGGAARRRGAARPPRRRGRRARVAPVAAVVLQRPLRDRLRGDPAAVGRLDAGRRAPRARARQGGGARRGRVQAVRHHHRGGRRDRPLPALARRAVGARPGARAPYPAVPTLLLQGGEDLRTPPEHSLHVAQAIPGAQRVVVPGVGHAVVGGDPAAAASARSTASSRASRSAATAAASERACRRRRCRPRASRACGRSVACAAAWAGPRRRSA